RPLCFDYYARNRHTGSFILIDIITNRTLGAGIIIEQSPENHHVRHADKEPRSKNIFRENTEIGATEREKIMGRRQPFTVWLTGLSGSGKSTIAKALQREIISMGIAVFILDGDNVRHGLNKDLGFSTADRNENIRRISEVAKLMNDAGLFVITSFISPFREDRSRAREVIGKERFIEVFIDADLETCRERDPKGLYKKVMEGEISDFTGIDSPYEKPLNAEIVIKTEELDIRESVKCIISELTERNILNIDHA
ncbi:MAG: adenylyl-sulfate kinase, partial [Victivallaceae bacterium]